MSFKENIEEDAKSVFLNTDEFAETVSYTPAGGSAKEIRALVIHKGLETGDENFNRSLRRQAEVYVANDATVGVTAVDKKDDRIEMKDIQGNTVTARVLEILGKDEGLWHLLMSW